MTPPFKLTRIPSLKTVEDFRRHVASLGLELPCDETLEKRSSSPLAKPIEHIRVNGKRIGNRFAIQPMEGWDGTTTGGATDEMLRRWTRFGESGAKLIYGGEAMAVRPDGRANPNQLIINEENKAAIANLRNMLLQEHTRLYGDIGDLVIGFQLTHSGRFSRPNDKCRLEPRIAYRHPILDKKFQITNDEAILTDSEIEELIRDYVTAARIAAEAGADQHRRAGVVAHHAF